jgi:hypothetical protein
MARWQQGSSRLKPNHRWKAKPGHQVFVAQRGAIRFDVPRDWVIIPGKTSYKVCDRQPPDDECTLEASYMVMPEMEMPDLTVSMMLRDVTDNQRQKTETWRGDLVEEKRGTMEIAQMASRWIDPSQNREACSHIALARRRGIQVLLTYDYWLSDAKQFGPVWLTVLETLQVAQWVNQDGSPAPAPALPNEAFPEYRLGLLDDGRPKGRA